MTARAATAIPCPTCSGYADRVDCTPDEISSPMNCGSGRWRYACCVAAFVCRLCGERTVETIDPPEME